MESVTIPGLTKRQAVVFLFIYTYYEREGVPPLQETVATGLGRRSKSNISKHIGRIVQAGYLTKTPRGPRPTEHARKVLRQLGENIVAPTLEQALAG